MKDILIIMPSFTKLATKLLMIRREGIVIEQRLRRLNY